MLLVFSDASFSWLLCHLLTCKGSKVWWRHMQMVKKGSLLWVLQGFHLSDSVRWGLKDNLGLIFIALIISYTNNVLTNLIVEICKTNSRNPIRV